jgi:hypothetical protein
LGEYVFDFARRGGLEDRFELLLFGARLARDKDEAMNTYEDELTAPEKSLLQKEKAERTGFFKQSKFFRLTIMVSSLGG